jgi:hypothetical protein
MFPALLSALAPFSLSSCSNYVRYYGAAFSIADIVFQGCSTAVYASNCLLNATITACTFVSCTTSSSGGGIYFEGTQLQTFRCSFTGCSASNVGGAMYVSQCSTAVPAQWHFTDNFMTRVSCYQAPVFCSAYDQPNGTDMAVERMNFTSNSADLTAALILEDVRNAVVEFCLFESNRGMCALTLNYRRGSGSLRCLGFRGNVFRDGNSQFKGMFCIYSSWTIADSVFDNNTFVWIVGQYVTDVNFTLTFRNCYFDAFVESRQGGALVELDDCEIGAGNLPSWGQCPNRTPRRSRTPTKSMSPAESRSPTRSMSPVMTIVAETEAGLSGGEIGAIIGGLGALFLLGIAVPCLCCCGRKKTRDDRDSERSTLESDVLGTGEPVQGARLRQGAAASRPPSRALPPKEAPPPAPPPQSPRPQSPSAEYGRGPQPYPPYSTPPPVAYGATPHPYAQYAAAPSPYGTLPPTETFPSPYLQYDPPPTAIAPPPFYPAGYRGV